MWDWNGLHHAVRRKQSCSPMHARSCMQCPTRCMLYAMLTVKQTSSMRLAVRDSPSALPVLRMLAICMAATQAGIHACMVGPPWAILPLTIGHAVDSKAGASNPRVLPVCGDVHAASCRPVNAPALAFWRYES